MASRILLNSLLVAHAAAGFLAAGILQAGDSVIPEFEASYKVRASVASGELSMSLTAGADGVYLFRTLTRPRGLVKIFARGEIDEQSHLMFKGNAVVPLDYTLRDTISKDHDADYKYDWAAGTVAGIERGESVSGELQPGMLNRAALYLALMLDLSNGEPPEHYLLFDRGKLSAYGVEKLGVETIEVPLGQFETVKLVRDSEGSSRSMLLWCAPKLNYLPIRIELIKGDKRISRAELKAVRGLSSEDQSSAPDPLP